MPPPRAGPRNLITDVDGILVGNAEDRRAWTGTTVVLPEAPCVAAVDVRGGAPGTRETDALDPACLVDRVHAVVLSGGSAFGLEAAAAVAAILAARGIGFEVGSARVPIVPAAILFDLLNGGEKGWGGRSPYRRLGRRALAAAATDFALGNAGAGFGAKADRLKGGLGSASIVAADGLQVGALAAVNPHGSAVMPGADCLWAWPFEREGELGRQVPPSGPLPADEDLGGAPPPSSPLSSSPAANTTIGVVATNAILDKAEARRLAIMAQDGYARAVRPAHTPFDGDTVFALATGRIELPEPRAAALARLGALAADCVARAVARGVFEAAPLGAWPAYREAHRAGFRDDPPPPSAPARSAEPSPKGRHPEPARQPPR
jgi:L-aminopeptidase/D-esterase-like protein